MQHATLVTFTQNSINATGHVRSPPSPTRWLYHNKQHTKTVCAPTFQHLALRLYLILEARLDLFFSLFALPLFCTCWVLPTFVVWSGVGVGSTSEIVLFPLLVFLVMGAAGDCLGVLLALLLGVSLNRMRLVLVCLNISFWIGVTTTRSTRFFSVLVAIISGVEGIMCLLLLPTNGDSLKWGKGRGWQGVLTGEGVPGMSRGDGQTSVSFWTSNSWGTDSSSSDFPHTDWDGWALRNGVTMTTGVGWASTLRPRLKMVVEAGWRGSRVPFMSLMLRFLASRRFSESSTAALLSSSKDCSSRIVCICRQKPSLTH